MTEKFFYICDKKPGACDSWEKFGWKKCETVVGCCHTTNKEHAKYKEGTCLISMLDGVEKCCHYEYIRLCKNKPDSCNHFIGWIGSTLCIEKNCPYNNPEVEP